MRVQACIALFFAIVINVLLRPRLPPRKSGPLVEWSAFREPTYALFTAGMFLIFWALYFCFFYVNTFATDPRIGIGLDDVQSVNLVVVISAVGMPVRPLLGWAADRHLGALPVMVVCATILGVSLFCWIPVHDVGGLYAWSVAYGVATGATQGIFVGALASLTKQADKMGTRFGMVCSVLAFASLAGPPTAGALIESDGGGFLRAQIWAGATTLAGAGLIGAAYWFSARKESIEAGVPMRMFGLPRRKTLETVEAEEEVGEVGGTAATKSRPLETV